MQYGAWKKVAHDSTGASTATSGPDGWESKITKAESVSSKSDANIKDYEALQKAYENLQKFGEQLIGNSDRQVLWIELLKTVNSVLPQEQTTWRDPDQIPFSDRPDFYIESIDNAYVENLNEWWIKVATNHEKGLHYVNKNRQIWIDGIQQNANFIANNKEFVEQMIALQEAAANAAAESNDGGAVSGGGGGPIIGGDEDGGAATAGGGPTDAGWIIQLTGYHFFNNDRETGDISHVHMALLERLRQSVIDLPIVAIDDTDTKFTMEQFTMEEMGISHIVLVSSQEDGEVVLGGASGGGDLEGDMGDLGGADSGAGAGGTGEAAANDNNGTTGEEPYKATKYSFVVQFCWVPTEPIKRLAAQQLAKEQAAEAANAAQAQAGGPNGDPGGGPADDLGDPDPDDNGPPIN
jgi:type IV pilus assembly protein PilM